MNTCLKRGLFSALFAGGVLVLGASAASAATGDPLTGTQANAPVSAPVTINTEGTEPVENTPALPVLPSTGSPVTSTQVSAPVTAPVTINTEGTEPVENTPALPGTGSPVTGTQVSAPVTINTEGTGPVENTLALPGTGSPVTGTQVSAPVTAPVTINTEGTEPVENTPALPALPGAASPVTGTQINVLGGAGTSESVWPDSLSVVGGAKAGGVVWSPAIVDLGLGADGIPVLVPGFGTSGGTGESSSGGLSSGPAGAGDATAVGGLAGSAGATSSGKSRNPSTAGFAVFGEFSGAPNGQEEKPSDGVGAPQSGAAGNVESGHRGSGEVGPGADVCLSQTGALRLPTANPVGGLPLAGMLPHAAVLGALAAVVLLLPLRRGMCVLRLGRRVGNWPDPCTS